jgi:hypothetical protein
MSLAAVPAYLLARLFVPPTPALLVAAGSALVPSMALTATVMTENAAYPLFLLAVWLMARTVRHPTLGGQLLMIAAIAIGAATRVSGAVLLPAFLVAVALYALSARPGERIAYLRRFTPTVVVLAAAVALPLLADLVDGGGVGWFGQRSGTLQYVHAGPFLRLLLYQTGDLILYAAVLPALAAAVMVGIGLSRRAAEPERLYAAVALPSVLAVLGSGVAVSSTYGIDGSTGLNERYVFSVVPLLLLGLACWIHVGMPRPRWALPLVVVVALVAALLPWDALEIDAGLYAQSLAPWVALPLGRIGTGIVVALAVLGVGWLWLRWRDERAGLTWVVALTVLVLLGLTTLGAYASHAQTAHDVYGEARRDWVDAAVPAGAKVTVLWDQRRAARDAQGRLLDGGRLGLYYRLMLTELFNPSIETVHRFGGATSYENHLPSIPVRLRADGVVVGTDDRPVTAHYVLAACDMAVRGRHLAESHDGVLGLWRTQRGLVADASAPCPG